MSLALGIAVTTAALAIANPAGVGERIARAYTDSVGAVHTVSTSGVDRARTRGRRFRDAKVSPDGRTYGALLISSIDTDPPHRAMAEVCQTLVIWRDGRKLRPVVPGDFIRDWGFWKNGEEVAVYSGALHFAGYYELLDCSSGKVLATSEDPVTDLSPPWVRALER